MKSQKVIRPPKYYNDIDGSHQYEDIDKTLNTIRKYINKLDSIEYKLMYGHYDMAVRDLLLFKDEVSHFYVKCEECHIKTSCFNNKCEGHRTKNINNIMVIFNIRVCLLYYESTVASAFGNCCCIDNLDEIMTNVSML